MSSETERAGARHVKPLAIALGLIVAYALVEVVAAINTGSLSLLSDAGHMGTDALGLGMALAAILTAQGASRRERQTYGLYRLEIMAAAANALLLLLVAGYAIFEGVRRLSDAPSLDAGPMLIVGIGGLVVNLVAARILRDGSRESMNVEGAYAEVMADFLGSAGVILAAADLPCHRLAVCRPAGGDRDRDLDHHQGGGPGPEGTRRPGASGADPGGSCRGASRARGDRRSHRCPRPPRAGP